jgi:N-acetylneuraminic acid mutarotase
VRYPAVAALDGKIYVFGGEGVGGADNGMAVRDIQMVNPLTGSAQVVGLMPEPLEGASAATLAGYIFVAGGNDSSVDTTNTVSSTKTIWVFDLRTATMRRAGSLRIAVSNAGIAVIGNTAWLVGGEEDGNPTSAVQMFRPDPIPRAPGG